MNLEQSLHAQALNSPNTEECLCEKARVSAEQMARRVFAAARAHGHPYENTTVEQWARKWLASDEFVLMEIDAAAVAIPLAPKNPQTVIKHMLNAAGELPPVVVDLNKRKIGRTPTSGYIPPVIVLDGKHRHMADVMNGHARVRAWVGVREIGRAHV